MIVEHQEADLFLDQDVLDEGQVDQVVRAQKFLHWGMVDRRRGKVNGEGGGRLYEGLGAIGSTVGSTTGSSKPRRVKSAIKGHRATKTRNPGNETHVLSIKVHNPIGKIQFPKKTLDTFHNITQVITINCYF